MLASADEKRPKLNENIWWDTDTLYEDDSWVSFFTKPINDDISSNANKYNIKKVQLLIRHSDQQFRHDLLAQCLLVFHDEDVVFQSLKIEHEKLLNPSKSLLSHKIDSRCYSISKLPNIIVPASFGATLWWPDTPDLNEGDKAPITLIVETTPILSI